MIDVKVLNQITDLEKKNCKSCTKTVGASHANGAQKICKECPIGKKIRKLGTKLEITRADKVLSKGESMTFTDVCFLLEQNVQMKRIYSALGFRKGEYETYMRRHGVDPRGNPLRKAATK
ncbi:zinc-finger domain-containing protein [Halobacillus sp. BBL2006]|uniref:zinc-finger domain-containing protein n=1 Tax=Halobacillus sp. BBL2006 TaxID=1543706 RepID=UPI0005432B73|nr:zinc-finger domain-containing protein [Halobacillus sp. BBL2006]KHE73165.1 hypothetical protein LD39_00840 [Halobacillus sp. BBL2006]